MLIEAAKAKQTVSYKQIGDAIHRHHRSVRLVLDPLQDSCRESRLPPLTVIVVKQDSKLPGSGFTAHHDIGAAFEEVFSFDWTNVPNPYGEFKPDDTRKKFAALLVNDPSTANEVYARVKVRGTLQNIFRDALMKAYGERCAFCGLQFAATLEAAHIKSWRESNRHERVDPTNGLLLCSTHHEFSTIIF